MPLAASSTPGSAAGKQPPTPRKALATLHQLNVQGGAGAPVVQVYHDDDDGDDVSPGAASPELLRCVPGLLRA